MYSLPEHIPPPGTNFGCRQQTATVSLSALRVLGRGSWYTPPRYRTKVCWIFGAVNGCVWWKSTEIILPYSSGLWTMKWNSTIWMPTRNVPSKNSASYPMWWKIWERPTLRAQYASTPTTYTTKPANALVITFWKQLMTEILMTTMPTIIGMTIRYSASSTENSRNNSRVPDARWSARKWVQVIRMLKPVIRPALISWSIRIPIH